MLSIYPASGYAPYVGHNRMWCGVLQTIKYSTKVPCVIRLCPTLPYTVLLYILGWKVCRLTDIVSGRELDILGYNIPRDGKYLGVPCKRQFLYSAISNPQDHSKRFTLYFPDRPVHSDTISASLGSIQPYATINARRLLIHISTIVYSQVLI